MTEFFAIASGSSEDIIHIKGTTTLYRHTPYVGGKVHSLEKCSESKLIYQNSRDQYDITIILSVKLMEDDCCHMSFTSIVASPSWQTPSASNILKVGYLKVKEHILCSRRLSVTVSISPNEICTEVKINQTDSAKVKKPVYSAEKFNSMRNILLGSDLVSAVTSTSPPCKVHHMNILIGPGEFLPLTLQPGNNGIAPACIQNCNTQNIVYKNTSKIGFNTGYRFCTEHQRFSLGYAPLARMYLYESPVKKELRKLSIKKPEFLLCLLATIQPMIAEIKAGKVFPFLPQVRSHDGVEAFLSSAGFSSIQTCKEQVKDRSSATKSLNATEKNDQPLQKCSATSPPTVPAALITPLKQLSLSKEADPVFMAEQAEGAVGGSASCDVKVTQPQTDFSEYYKLWQGYSFDISTRPTH